MAIFEVLLGSVNMTGMGTLGHGGMSALSPFYPQLRTLVGAAGTLA
jgi:hypothetical protein